MSSDSEDWGIKIHSITKLLSTDAALPFITWEMKLIASRGERPFHCIAIDRYVSPPSSLFPLLQKSNYTPEMLTINSISAVR